MKELIKIIKLLFIDAFRARKGGKKGYIIAIAFLYLLFEMGIIMVLIGVTPIINEQVLLAEFVTFIMTIGLTAVAALGIMSMLNLLYFSRDSEFFLSLPVSPAKVYFAKLISVYITQLVILAAIMIPALFTVGLCAAQGIVFYLTVIVATAFLPVFSLLALSMICLPLMYVVRFFKNRGAVSSVMAMAVYIVIFVVYIMAVTSTNALPEDAEMVRILTAPMKNAARIFIPFTAISRFATLTPMDGMGLAISMIVEALIFFGFIAGLFAVAVLISRFAYSHAVALQLENRKRTNISIAYKNRTGATKALMIKEWKNIIRTPVFAMQCLMGIIITPVILLLFVFTSEMPELSDVSFMLTEIILVFVISAMVQMMGVSVNIGASTAFSREGKAFYISKLLPVPYTTQVKAKALLFNIIYSIEIVICFAILVIVLPSVWWLIIMALFYMLIINCGFIALCLLFDLSNVNLEWKSYREIVKNSRNSVLPMLIGMAISIVFGLVSVGLTFAFNRLIPLAPSAIISMAVMIAFALAFALSVNIILMKNCPKYFSSVAI